MYTIRFEERVEKTISKWKKSNPILLKKLVKLLHAIADDPRAGIGHPEPMIGGENMLYSRRISAHDRIIYKIFDEEIVVIIIQLEGHYDDK